MTARIFDIQRFSLHDGPGIRTTVFLKGCNLRCLWCHNPESQSGEKELMHYFEKCTGCGRCKSYCERAFTENCTKCGSCAKVCPFNAREQSGKDVETDDIIKTALRDTPFYGTSGGGVTLSGGEPLLQADAAFEILSACKEKGVHTAVETAGNVPFEVIKKMIPVTDLFLFDIKGIDEKKHKTNTGVSNRLILENARLSASEGALIRFRMPYIPGYNSDEASAVAELAKSLGSPLELMAYHRLGEGKYKALSREYALRRDV